MLLAGYHVSLLRMTTAYFNGIFESCFLFGCARHTRLPSFIFLSHQEGKIRNDCCHRSLNPRNDLPHTSGSLSELKLWLNKECTASSTKRRWQILQLHTLIDIIWSSLEIWILLFSNNHDKHWLE